MGILGTRWEAEHAGHSIVVSRNELTKGFSLEWDGTEIARRTWSLIGLGELHGSAESNGQPVEIHVAIRWGGLSELDGKCTVTVDGQEVPVRHVK
jgi:hypothetical protein